MSFIAGLLIVTSPLLAQTQEDAPQPNIEQGVIIKFTNPAALREPQFLDLLREWNITEVTQSLVEYRGYADFDDVFLVAGAQGTDIEGLAEALAGVPGVSYAVVNTEQFLNTSNSAIEGEANPSGEEKAHVQTTVIFEPRSGRPVHTRVSENLEILSIPISLSANNTISTLRILETMLKALGYRPKAIQMSFDLPEPLLTYLALIAERAGTTILDSQGQEVLPYSGEPPSPMMRRPDYLAWVTQSNVRNAEYIRVYWSHLPSAVVTNTDFIGLFDQTGTPVSWVLPSPRQINVTAVYQGSFQFLIPGRGAQAGTYHFRYCPAAGNCFAFSNPFTVTIRPPVVISNVSVTNISDTSACFLWTTNEDADSSVGLGQETFYRPERPADPEPVTAHAFRVTDGMYGGGTFYYHTTSNTTMSPRGSFNTPFNPDLTPPVISGVTATPTRDSVTVVWNTNEDADSELTLDYYPNATTRIRQIRYTSRLVRAHQKIITNLVPNTLHYYFVKSRDTALNSAQFPPQPQPPLQVRTLP